jgi:hypothetical protein
MSHAATNISNLNDKSNIDNITFMILNYMKTAQNFDKDTDIVKKQWVLQRIKWELGHLLYEKHKNIISDIIDSLKFFSKNPDMLNELVKPKRKSLLEIFLCPFC